METSKLFAQYGIEFLGTLSIIPTSLSKDIQDFTPGQRMHTLIHHSSSIPEYKTQKLASDFKGEENLILFVHQNTYHGDTPHPVFCVMYVSHTGKELLIGRKFRRGNLQTSKSRELFLELLYSEENKTRLEKYGLSIAPIEQYSPY